MAGIPGPFPALSAWPWGLEAELIPSFPALSLGLPRALPWVRVLPAATATLTYQVGYTSGGGGCLLFFTTLDPTAQLFQAQLALLPWLWACVCVCVCGGRVLGGGHMPRNIHKKCNPLPRAHVSLTCLQPVGLQLTLGLTSRLPPQTPTIPSWGGLWSCPSTLPPQRGRGLVDSLG